jgi:lipopolysaccharide transport system ATP-binding protein
LTPIVVFEHISKRYKLHHDRPRSFRELFVRGALAGRPSPAEADTLWALRDVSFEIQPGETVGLIGANGAGKSTALKLISRVILPTQGRLQVNGRVAALLELGTGFQPELSGRDNVFLSGALSGMSRQEMSLKYDDIVDFAEMAAFIDIPVKHYSSGMFARLAFAVSIHINPDVLLVDEALAVGDQSFQRKCLERIAELQRAGVTVCFVSHAPDIVRDLCSRVIWFDHGAVVADGAADGTVRRYLDHSFGPTSRLGTLPADLPSEKRWGSRKVEIERVRLLDDQGQPQDVFTTGGHFRVVMDYRAAEPVSDAVFGLALVRHDGVHVTGPNTRFSGLPLPRLQGRGTISYDVPYLPLLDGRYEVSVSAHNSGDTEMFDFHDRAYSFRVYNPETGIRERYGLITLRGEWQHAPADEPAAEPDNLAGDGDHARQPAYHQP